MRIIAIDSFNGGWVIQYEVPAPCGCYFDREALYVAQTVQPTIDEAKQLINDSNN